MEKVIVLEFDSDATLEEIKEEMKFYQKNRQIVMTIINGVEIFSNDSQ